MSENEKKIKLEELPDAALEPAHERPAPRINRNTPEPRIQKLKQISDQEKIVLLDQTWHFDEREKNFGWLFFVFFLVLAELTPFYENYIRELDLLNLALFDIGGDIIREFTIFFEGIIRHPIILVLLTPIFFRFNRESAYSFDITFDGIRTVKKILPKGSKEMISRVFIKWGEIDRIEKVFIDQKEILRIYSAEGAVAEVIWYIILDKKMAIRHLVNGLIGPKHPFGIFLANEKELS